MNPSPPSGKVKKICIERGQNVNSESKSFLWVIVLYSILISLGWLLSRAIFPIAAWRWGDWKNWKNYQPTILYLISLDLLYNVLTSQHPLWRYTLRPILPSGILPNLVEMIVAYPGAMILYLSLYPKAKHKFLYILMCTCAFSLFEGVYALTGVVFYDNGWHYYMSVPFNFLALLMVRLHHTKPLLAYVLTFFIVAALLFVFKVPIPR